MSYCNSLHDGVETAKHLLEFQLCSTVVSALYVGAEGGKGLVGGLAGSTFMKAMGRRRE